MRTFAAASLMAAIFWTGCARNAPIHPPATTPEPPQPTKREQSLERLLGNWELAGKGGKLKQILFDPGGQVTFRGGLEFYNPGFWRLDADQEELTIALPQASNEKLDIFHMYLGNGVKAFDRPRKEITYQFNADTWNLNVAGWTYSKPDKPTAPAEVEPVIK